MYKNVRLFRAHTISKWSALMVYYIISEHQITLLLKSEVYTFWLWSESNKLPCNIITITFKEFAKEESAILPLYCQFHSKFDMIWPSTQCSRSNQGYFVDSQRIILKFFNFKKNTYIFWRAGFYITLRIENTKVKLTRSYAHCS